MAPFKDILFRFFYSKNSNKNSNQILDKSSSKVLDDLGVFTYSKDSFSVTLEGKTEQINWNDILQINVFKMDLIAVDEIRMQLICNNLQLEISEELTGWFQFTIKLKEIFPSIPIDWDIEIIHPAFAENFRIIYSKNTGNEQPKTSAEI